MKRLKVVIDTNVFLVSLPSKHEYHWIFQAILSGKFELCVSTEILIEYQEIVALRYGLQSTDATLDFLLFLPNIVFITPFFKYPLIHADPSDNKFVECALMANADFIVSNDRHFQQLKNLDFPPINVFTYEEFKDFWVEQSF
ncbi:MAG: putative toxin-antitoxin system toxin component, PIN family [Saprospiraceae bacterium]|nr:putative toxin-antitoxin system toxin component, PIN family [Saprospiraceae bacterium]